MENTHVKCAPVKEEKRTCRFCKETKPAEDVHSIIDIGYVCDTCLKNMKRIGD